MQDVFGVEISKGAIQRTYYAAQASAANPDAGVRENAKFIYNARLKRVNRGNVSKGVGTKALSVGRKVLERRDARINEKTSKIVDQYFKEGDKLGREVKLQDFTGRPERLTSLSEGAANPQVSGVWRVTEDQKGLKERALKALGARKYEIGFKEKKPGAKNSSRSGVMVGTVMPSGRVRMDDFHMHGNASRTGVAGVVGQLTERAPQAKNPGIYFKASGYDSAAAKNKGGSGHDTWRRIPGVRYVPGMGYGLNSAVPFYPKRLEGVLGRTQIPFVKGKKTKITSPALTKKERENYDYKYTPLPEKLRLDPKMINATRKDLRRHMVRAATGKETPRDVVNLSPEARAWVKDKHWNGHIRGRTPFLGKTKITAGGVAGGGVVVGGTAAQKKFEEQEHPRGFGGKFRTKGYKSAYKSVLDRQNKVSKSSEGTNQISSSIWSS